MARKKYFFYPAPIPTHEQEAQIVSLIDRVLDCRGGKSACVAGSLQAQIDDAVYKLYGLAAVEGEYINGTKF